MKRRPDPDDDEQDAPDEEESAATPEPLLAKAPSRKKTFRLIAEKTAEYRELGPEAQAGLGPAITRRHELAKELRALTTYLFVTSEDVEIVVTPSATGHPYRIGERVFAPGIYTVKAPVAATLGYMMSMNDQTERERLRASGGETRLNTGLPAPRLPIFSRSNSRAADIRYAQNGSGTDY